ncbi:MAG: hypothetical protein WBQ05_03575 [Candidatus Competibacter denitrificans]|nr:hypothetical protein [Candidatus Competibacter denitrificans]
MAPKIRLPTEARQKEIIGAVLALAADNSPDAITTRETVNSIV